jgi:hypothetical protein
VKYLNKVGRWSVRCESNGAIVKAKPENLVRKYVKAKRDERKSKTTHVTQKDYDAESFDALFRRDGGRETTDDITDFRYILSPIDGMPPLWPRPPKWPFDPELTKRYAKRLRVADYAHRHFNHLADLHAKDSAVTSI